MGRSGDIRIGSTHPESHSPSSLKSHTEVEKQLSGSLPTGRSVSFIHPEFRTLKKRHEQVKHNHYGAAANEANLKVIPMIQDTHGAWGKEAKRTLRILFHRIARRFGQPVSAVARVWKTELQSLHEQRIANILLAVQERTPTIAAELGAETVEV